MSDIQMADIDAILAEIPAAASEGAPDFYDLDDHHRFVKGEPLSVCGNSCAMVENTRVGKFFEVTGGTRGEGEVHGGPYPGCGNIPYSAEEVWA